jgi:putative addiction module component (TIGR02574 family)
MTLTEAERAQLASELVASLDGPADHGIEKAWDIEICRRINAIEAGKESVLDTKTVLTSARSRIRR